MRTYEMFTRMDLTAEDMNSSNLSELLLEKVKSTYEKKCMKKRYIFEVVKIAYEGEVVIHSYDNTSMGSIDLVILVKYLYFTKGDIIVNCRIGHVDSQGKYICSNEFIKSKVAVSNPIYKIGRSIPIVIEGCKYTVYDKFIAVYGTDVTRFGDSVLLMRIATIQKKINDETFESLRVEMKELEQELSDIKKPELRKKFDDILFSKNSGGKKGGSLHNFKASVGDILIVGIRPSIDNNYYVSESTDQCADAAADDVHASLIQAYNKSLRNMIHLLSWYDDERFAADADIWKLMR